MPDWSYQTVLKPVLRATRPLRLLDAFGRSRVAGPLVALLGDMDPGPDAAVRLGGRQFPGRVGLSARLPAALASLASRFGVGFVELSAADALARASRPRAWSAPLAVRLGGGPGAAAELDAVAPLASLVTAPRADAALAARARALGLPLLAAVRDAAPASIDAARASGAAGLWLEDASPADVAQARQAWPEALLVAGGPMAEPAEVLALLDASADLAALDRGLAEAGPGLPKRVEEAVRHRRQESADGLVAGRWLGMAAYAMVLLVAGLAAWALGATVVLLPYDYRFLGMGRAGLEAINPRLVDFLAHDRISFAATTLSMAFLMLQAATQALRRQEAWAKRLLATAGAAGFASFFLFLGFGYLDPLHVVVWAAAAVAFLWGLRAPAKRRPWVPAPDLRNDAAWRRALWGQLLFVGLAFGLVVAGAAVSAIASGPVFVGTDLGFLEASPGELDSANGRLLPLVAHDRAGFGGALAADGLGVLLLALWGFRRGAAWVWWTLLVAGVVGFAGVLWIHAEVGYLHLAHLTPAYLALATFVAGLGLSRRFLLAR